MSQQQSQPEPSDIQSSMNLLMVVLHIYSTSIEVFLHRGMGARYPAWFRLGSRWSPIGGVGKCLFP